MIGTEDSDGAALVCKSGLTVFIEAEVAVEGLVDVAAEVVVGVDDLRDEDWLEGVDDLDVVEG